jgi:hypothetical protein
MKIITGGCSFSAHRVEEKLAWPNHLRNKGIDVFNTAEMASGNQIIVDRLCAFIDKEKYDYCIVMWSNPYRFEFFLNKEHPNYDTIYQQMKEKTSFTNFILNNGKSESHENSNWLTTGGGYGFWKYDQKDLDSMFENYLANHFNCEYQFIQTCKSIIMLQSICKVSNIRLINTCWQNIWDDLYEVKNQSLRGSNWLDKESIDKLKNKEIVYDPVIDKYPNARHWYDMIDWSSWLFYENEFVKRGGLGEFAVIENNDVLDNSHPNDRSQQMWAEFIMEKIKNW